MYIEYIEYQIFYSGGLETKLLHSNCHYQISYSKCNLNIQYRSPYERSVWDYNRENAKRIEKSIESANWEVMFVDESVYSYLISMSNNENIF